MSFRNRANRSSRGIRIDTRPASEYTAAGMRHLHRDTDGGVIGGVDKHGVPFGSKVRRSGLGGSSIGAPSTPGLDSNPVRPVPTAAAAPGSSMLAGRQQLHREMVAAGRTGVTPEMQARAKNLGVSASAWSRVANAVPEAPGMLAAPSVAKPPLAAAGRPRVNHLDQYESMPMDAETQARIRNSAVPPASAPAMPPIQLPPAVPKPTIASGAPVAPTPPLVASASGSGFRDRKIMGGAKRPGL